MRGNVPSRYFKQEAEEKKKPGDSAHPNILIKTVSGPISSEWNNIEMNIQWILW